MVFAKRLVIFRKEPIGDRTPCAFHKQISYGCNCCDSRTTFSQKYHARECKFKRMFQEVPNSVEAITEEDVNAHFQHDRFSSKETIPLYDFVYQVQ